MGSGAYSQIIFGIMDLKEAGFDEVAVETLLEIARDLDEDLNVVFSTRYEAATEHLGIPLVSTLGRRSDLSIGTCRIDDLSTIVRQRAEAAMPSRHAKQTSLETAREHWKELQARAAAKGITVPDGELIWVDDYD